MNWLRELCMPVKHFTKLYALSSCRFLGFAPEVPKSCNTKPPPPNPNVLLSDGRQIPMIGLGTWLSPPGQVEESVKYAISIGYRHIDCAYLYQNEQEVGDGIRQALKKTGLKRKDIWVTSKLWNTHHRPDLVHAACEASLRNLGLNYLDLYLMHWPMAYREGGFLVPLDACGKILHSLVDYVDTWKQLEKLHRHGLVKSIGVANFNKRQIDRILEVAKIPPVINQIECHPYLTQKKLIQHCKSKKIAVTCYSPLGAPKRPWAKPDDPVVIEDSELKYIGKRYKKSAAQIALRYQVQRGNIVIPKAVTKEHIAANIDIFTFEMTKGDMATIDSINRDHRFVHMMRASKNPHHPFVNDEY